MAVEVPQTVQVAVESIQSAGFPSVMAVEHIAGAAATGVAVSQSEPVGIAAELMNGVQSTLTQLLVVVFCPQP
jgi:hypothetical protein